MQFDSEDLIDKSTQTLAPLLGVPSKVMFVWEFYEAPDFVRAHSTHGGDEDGILWIPNGVTLPVWVERLWSTYGGPDVIHFKDGVLVIWAHS